MPFKDAEDRRQYQRERQRAARAKKRAAAAGEGSPPPAGEPPDECTAAEPLPLKTAKDALAILQEQINHVRADQQAGPQTRARTCAYLIAVGLKAMEVTELAERIAAIEERLAGTGQPNNHHHNGVA